MTLAMLGREAEAMEQLRQTLAATPDRQFRSYHVGLLGTLEGNREKAVPALVRVASHNRDPESRFYQLRSLAKLGERETALDLLENVARSFFPVYTFEHDPWLAPLRDSPRFASILAAARERHEQARGVWQG